jgi:hypothetical protein
MKQQIEERYKIKPGTLPQIAAFKKFIGDKTFEQILQGVAEMDIPFEEEKYCDLLKTVLVEPATKEELIKIPYSDAEEILSFFCRPFAGRLLKRAKSMLNGMSSLLGQLDPQLIVTAMESISSLKKSGISLDVSSSQTEASNPVKESIN